jgi:hypothetical protein
MKSLYFPIKEGASGPGIGFSAFVISQMTSNEGTTDLYCCIEANKL